MAYRPRRFTNQRDETYVKQISSERPILAPRIQCSEDPDVFEDNVQATLRGRHLTERPAPHEKFEESGCERFQRLLRVGHGFRNEGEE